ncbi:MAG TPA: polymer-forming cytoskeletal protein [Myxococcota bacterium]|jgi:cytoskeletal protein CcmA (bactofilin family)
MAMRPAGWRRLVLGAPAQAAPSPQVLADPGVPEADVARLHYGAEMNGRLVVEQSLLIEGDFRGELESANTVFVAETGTVEAPIRARTVEIRGAVVGDVVAAREVVIFASGRLHGDVETPSLVVERGATFNGRTRMYRPERSLQAPALATLEAPMPSPEREA